MEDYIILLGRAGLEYYDEQGIKYFVDSELCAGDEYDYAIYEKYSHDELAKLGDGESVGVCHDVENPSTINYMAGYIVVDVDKAKSMGLDVLKVKEAEYAESGAFGQREECPPGQKCTALRLRGN